MNYIVSASTDRGIVKNTNQDSLNVKVVSCGNQKIVFAILCDGMGGLEKGEVASANVVHAFHRWITESLPTLCATGITDADIRREWTDIITSYNEKLKVYGKRCAVNLGTTVAAILLTDERYYIVNVGDSRVYEIQQYAHPLTKDQTVVAMEVEQGMITEEEAKVDSRRSVLLQCVGASDVVYPDFFFGQTKQDAVYMLCSDGFRHEISPEEIFGYLQPARMVSAESMKENELALIELNKQRQERDNISVITIRTF
ncbi:MAG: serine/threonine-protein phosphatase [Lachnospiraceae bacterium]|nr:serine/threonine-protein phosphatase [Lachnospiraceae bacterium]